MSKEKGQLPIYKIVMLGSSTVGKTSMISQFINNYFDALNEETNDDFREYIKLVNLNKGDPNASQYCILKIVDLFGIDHPDLKEGGDPKKQELLKKLIKNDFLDKETKQTHQIYRDKKVYGYMFVYDVTNYETLEKVVEFIEFIVENEKKVITGVQNLISKKILIGNKTDLKKREGDKFSKTLREIAIKARALIAECSAFENIHIDQCFEDLAREIYTDVAFEAYEQEQANNLANKEEGEEQEKRDEEVPKKKTIRKKQAGFLGCGGGQRKQELEDDDDENEDENQKNAEQIAETNQLPEISNQANGCSQF